MIKYVMIAAAAKAFSINGQTERVYRHLGNAAMSRLRKREGFPNRYRDRAQLFLDLVKKYDAVHHGDKLLEVGTGWVHWEAVCMRLFYDVDITLFDVWDNRLLDTFKQYFTEFANVIDTVIDIPPDDYAHVHSLLSSISAVNSFDELYDLLRLQYVLEPTGTLKRFPDESYDLIFSFDVLEHVKRDILADYVRDMYRLLKPGGYSIHQIDIADHLAYYDPAVNQKNYMRYPDKVWDRLFENDVLYFNRVQRPEWMSLFSQAGLVLTEQVSMYGDGKPIEVDNKYKDLNKQDANCVLLRLIHRKPK